MTRVCFPKPYVGEGIVDWGGAMALVDPDEDIFEVVELQEEIIKRERSKQIYIGIEIGNKK